jgi:hypothetical protein
MQPALHMHFEPALSHLCMSCPLDQALPSQLHPMSIVGTLTQRAKELGHPEYMALTTRTLHDAPVNELDMYAVFGQRQCYICQSTTHTMRECPTRKRLEEPAICRQLGLPPVLATISQVATSTTTDVSEILAPIADVMAPPADVLAPLAEPAASDFQ